MPVVIEKESSSRPGIVIVAIIALLIVAGIAVWAVTREPSVERSTSTTTNGTTTERYETQTQPPAENQGTTQAPEDNTTPPASPDSSGN